MCPLNGRMGLGVLPMHDKRMSNHAKPRVGERVVAAAFAQLVLDTARSAGVAPASLAQAAGLAPATLQDLPESLPQILFLRLLAAARQRSGDPDFGLHCGLKARPASFSLLGYLMMNCVNLGQAFWEVRHYESLVHQLGTTGIETRAEKLALRWDNAYQDQACARDLSEMILSGVLACGQSLAGQALPLLAVDFVHAAPTDAQGVLRRFAVPVRFEQSANRLWFPSRVASWPIAQADTRMRDLFRQHAQRLLEPPDPPDVLLQLRQALFQVLPQRGAHLRPLAQSLGMAPRTLQRRLAEQGQSFQRILDEVRQELARQYLADPRLSLVEIGYLLGYKTQSAFHHAFRSWTGQTPLRFRTQQRRRVLRNTGPAGETRNLGSGHGHA